MVSRDYGHRGRGKVPSDNLSGCADSNLVNKGWVIDPSRTDRNVYLETAKTAEQRKSLGGKRPDYILYQENTDVPIAIIEAKKGGSDLKGALEQGTEYAHLLKAPLVFAMNGAYCETRYVPNQLDLFLNGNEVRELIRHKEALAFLNQQTNDAYTVDKKFIISRQELIKVFAKTNNLLRDANIMSGYDRISEFANILFLRRKNRICLGTMLCLHH